MRVLGTGLVLGEPGARVVGVGAAVRASRTSRAVLASTRVGTQPVFTHVPPVRVPSTRAVRAPSSAARTAADVPAGPPPTTTTSSASGVLPAVVCGEPVEVGWATRPPSPGAPADATHPAVGVGTPRDSGCRKRSRDRRG